MQSSSNSGGTFTTVDNIPPQTLGHIQHECEALSEIHTLAHHRCWRFLHTDLDRLAHSEWRFIGINGGKSLRTIWAELGDEFPEIFNLCSAQTLDNAAMDQEMKRHDSGRRGRPLTLTYSGTDRT
jgi:hypothetical protein